MVLLAARSFAVASKFFRSEPMPLLQVNAVALLLNRPLAVGLAAVIGVGVKSFLAPTVVELSFVAALHVAAVSIVPLGFTFLASRSPLQNLLSSDDWNTAVSVASRVELVARAVVVLLTS